MLEGWAGQKAKPCVRKLKLGANSGSARVLYCVTYIYWEPKLNKCFTIFFFCQVILCMNGKGHLIVYTSVCYKESTEIGRYQASYNRQNSELSNCAFSLFQMEVHLPSLILQSLPRDGSGPRVVDTKGLFKLIF